MHGGRCDTAANANANYDAPRKFTSEFQPPNLKQKAANEALRRNPLANANGFANETARISSSLQKFLANGRLRLNALAFANVMAWCTQCVCEVLRLNCVSTMSPVDHFTGKVCIIFITIFAMLIIHSAFVLIRYKGKFKDIDE